MLFDASIALIFGGCCSNVWTLEALLKYESAVGLLVTFFQLFLTALVALPSQLERPVVASEKSRTGAGARPAASYPYPPRTSSLIRSGRSKKAWLPHIKSPQIPLGRLLFIAGLFTSVNVLNNWAFAFDISVPLHIVLRSFGSATTMTIGWFFGKRYSAVQVGSIVALTVGVVISAWADALQKGTNTSLTLTKSSKTSFMTFLSGLLILFLAQLISAFMGVFVEATYRRYGRHWRENLFYSHMFGLSFAIALYPTLTAQAAKLWDGPPITDSFLSLASPSVASLPITYMSNLLPAELVARMQRSAASIPMLNEKTVQYYGARFAPSQAALLLLGNGITQVACISGVNRLSAQTTALTVTVVLNIRKLVSFLLSCAIFGNKLSGLMVLGAAVVFGSGAVYGWDSALRSRKAAAANAAGVTPSGESARRFKKSRSGVWGHRGGVRVNSVTLNTGEKVKAYDDDEFDAASGQGADLELRRVKRRTRRSVSLHPHDGSGTAGAAAALGITNPSLMGGSPNSNVESPSSSSSPVLANGHAFAGSNTKVADGDAELAGNTSVASSR